MRAQEQEILKINEALRRIGMSPGVDAGQLLSDLIDEWGGTRKFAVDVKVAFDAAPEGSMVRQRFFEMIQRLVLATTDRDLAREVDPSEFSDLELARAAAGILGHLSGEGQPDVQETAAAAGRAVEDELQRPLGAEADPAAGEPPADGGWGDWGR
jgi:hypothetical protein